MVVLDVFGVLALFSKSYIGVYYTCDCSCMVTTGGSRECAQRLTNRMVTYRLGSFFAARELLNDVGLGSMLNG